MRFEVTFGYVCGDGLLEFHSDFRPRGYKGQQTIMVEIRDTCTELIRTGRIRGFRPVPRPTTETSDVGALAADLAQQATGGSAFIAWLSAFYRTECGKA